MSCWMQSKQELSKTIGDCKPIENGATADAVLASRTGWSTVCTFACFFVACVMSASATAAVSRIEVLSRTSVAGGASFGDAGPYEKITGRLHFAIDPDNPANHRIADIGLAPTDDAGRVTFSGDFVLIKPLDSERGNGRLLYGVNNRGNIVMLHTFNDAPWRNDPSSATDFGNGFLLNRGYTLLWSAWNWDVLAGNGRLQIDLPIATDGGNPIIGPVAAEMTTDREVATLPVAWGGSRGYPPANPDQPEATLTVRPSPDAARRRLPRRSWRFVGKGGGDGPVAVSLDGGFQPGRLYEVVYTAKDPRVTGLGLAAVRDAISFFRFETTDEAGNPNPLSNGRGINLPTAMIYGFSQSARVIQHIILEGLHVDESGRPVFDAALIHGSGAGKGSFNHRFAQTTRHPSHREDHLYPADFFPFTTAPQRDPVTGSAGGLLDSARRAGAVPYLFYLSAATEYWTRAASLLHTDVEGARDLEPSSKTRIYALAGAPHGVSAQRRRGSFENCPNPLDWRPVARALLRALNAWATEGREPPASTYPRLADGALGTVEAYRRAFPDVPKMRLPEGNLRPSRLALGPRFAGSGIADLQPARRGVPFETRVPLPDHDGLDRGGIRVPATAAPLGTYLGWNLHRRTQESPAWLGRWQGSFIPFAATEAERRAARDPRLSIAERYGSEDVFMDRTAAAADELVGRGLLLPADVWLILGRARRAYRTMTTIERDGTCRFLGRWQYD